MKNHIITITGPSGANDISLTGGKGMNLFKLTEQNIQVPPFIVLSTLVFKKYVKTLGKDFRDAISGISTVSPSTIAKTAGSLRSLFTADKLDKALKAEILKELKKQIPEGTFVAVRSSATAEDSADFSYAGQLDSFLFCKSDKEIINAVVDCWASGFSDRAIAYRSMKDIPHDEVEVAVVIQEMIHGQISGVSFTVNPLTQRLNELLINSAYGLGEGLVSGELDADQFIFDKGNNEISFRELAKKVEKIDFNEKKKTGTRKKKIMKKDVQDASSLTDEQIQEVGKTCLKIEKLYGGIPQDIEWTIDKNNNLFILQSRPITTLSTLRPPTTEYMTVWDNSNIVESYSGVTAPLTFTFALDAYHMVYVQFCEVLKVAKPKIQESDFFFANMLGLLHGRVYYNLKNWYRLISVLPGYKYNSKFMEQMMGVKSKLDFKPKTKKISNFSKYFIELPRLVWSGVNLMWQFLTIDSKVKKFMKIYTKMYNKYKDHDFKNDSCHNIIDIYFDLEAKVLRNWKAPIINDFMAMIFYGVLGMLIKKWDLEDKDAGGSLQNELLAGQGDVESILPMKRLQEISKFIRKEPDLMEKIKETKAEDLVDVFIGEMPEDASGSFKKLNKMIIDYLDEFGYRSMNELKLEEPSLSEKPQFVFSILKNYVAAPLPELTNSEGMDVKIRLAAEKLVSDKFAKQGFFGTIKHKLIFNPVVYMAKKAVAFREYQRFARTKMFGMVRRMFMGIGTNFSKLGVIEETNDIFYLTKQEIFSFIVGTSTISNLSEIVNIRKKEFTIYENTDELPDRIKTFGPVYCNDLTEPAEPVESGEIEPGVYSGISCCPGIVRGKVKVIMHPSDDMNLNGEILVAARTDPGWVPLYPSAAGLLIERGSILSHSAIVARELGLPAIVGISGITKALETGDEIEMDGARGTIKILKITEQIEENLTEEK